MSTYNPFSSDFLRSGADDRLRPQGMLAYVAGATDDPLKFMTIPQLLDRACARHGGRTAVIFAANGVELSWYDLRQRSNDVAAGLLALGIGRGDRVGIWAPNRAEWLYVQFGTARIGAILVNINPAYRTFRRGYHSAGAVLRQSRRARPCRLHISDDGLPTVVDVDVFDANMLVSTVPEATEGLDLHGISAQQSRRRRSKCDYSALTTTATSEP